MILRPDWPRELAIRDLGDMLRRNRVRATYIAAMRQATLDVISQVSDSPVGRDEAANRNSRSQRREPAPA
jgi:hypothetical protein